MRSEVSVKDSEIIRKGFNRYITKNGNHIVNEWFGNIIIKYGTIRNASNSGYVAMFDKRLITILETYDKTLNPFSKNL